jgi:hypothetical protein
MKSIYKRILFILYSVSILLSLGSCSKFVTVDPPANALVNENVFQDEATANAAMVNLFEKFMTNTNSFVNGGNSLYTGLSGDELELTSTQPELNEIYSNNIQASNIVVYSIWEQLYKVIYQSNSIQRGLLNSSSIAEAKRAQLLGEARFVRAYSYFQLVQLFGPVPLLLDPDYRSNATAVRQAKEQVLSQIVSDLEYANGQLAVDFSTSKGERVRPNRYAAKALLAQVYLYQENWTKAAGYATEIIDQTELFQLAEDPSKVFLPDAMEAIWQLKPVVPNQNTGPADLYVYSSNVPQWATLDSNLVNAFEEGDQRKQDWIYPYDFQGHTYFQPFKYKYRSPEDGIEYLQLFRLAEQLLIRAESRAHAGDLAGALSDLNAIRSRAGLEEVNGLDAEGLLLAIFRERRVELFVENGQRWYDLKRTNQIDAVLLQHKDNWTSNAALFPLPLKEIVSNPFLTQNSGY